MGTTLCLLRHGRATGQAPDAGLMHEGAEHITALGRRLARYRFSPALAFCSPYLRARETARLLLAEVAPGMVPEQLHELTPDHDPARTIAVLEARDLPAARVLLVGHLPLLGLLVQRLAADVVAFSPGMLVEVEMEEDWSQGRVTRTVGPDGKLN
jgi:phosphohistidine phosphatase SixA